MKFEVGQTLWLVNKYGRNLGCEVTVTKVGNKWVYLDSFGRCDFNGFVDGDRYSSPRRCYESKEAFEKEQRLESAWSRFKNEVSDTYTVPFGVTVEVIDAVSHQLFGGTP